MPQPPAKAPRGVAGATAPAGAPEVPRLVLPSSGSLPTSSPTSTDEKRGLFGISWLGGRRATTRDDVDSPPSNGSARGDDVPSNGIAAFFERASVLLVLGLFALIGVGSGVYLMFLRPDPVAIPPRVYTIPLPSPTFQPLVVAGATDFLAALPTADLAYGLRTAEPKVMHPVTMWPSRFAEEWLLTYDDGAGGTMTVQAVQHYTLEAATSTYQHLLDSATAEAKAAQSAGASPAPSSSPSASPSPSPSDVAGITVGTVLVNKVEVGKSFTVTKDVTESVPDPAGGDPTEVTHHVSVVTWQNGTAIFVMTADPAVIGDLFTEYGV